MVLKKQQPLTTENTKYAEVFLNDLYSYSFNFTNKELRYY